MTERERQILALIREDPLISQLAIAQRLGVSRSAVAGHIMRLTTKGVIRGRAYVVSEAPFIAVIGGANVDIHGTPASPLRMQDSNPGTVQVSPGGVARNIAENLARLGADCRLIVPIGNDQHGQMLLQHGLAAGIDMRHVVKFESAQTSTYISVLDDHGDMQVAVSDMGIIEQLGPEQLQPHEQMLKQAAMIVLDTNLRDDALAYLCGTFADKPLFADTVSTAKAPRIRPHLGTLHTLKPSLTEAETLAGIRVRTDRQLPKLARWFHAQGVRRLFVTLGERGVFYSTGDAQGVERLDGGGQKLHNAGGAGDAFMAGLAYAWLSRWTLGKSLPFALAAAAITMSHGNTVNPTVSLTTVRHRAQSSHAD